MLATPFFHLLKPEILELSLTPLFLSNPTSNPSGNPVGSTLKIYAESDHLLVISCCTTVAQTTIIFLQDYCSSLPTGFPSMLSLLQLEGSIYWNTSQIMLLLCSQPSSFPSHSEWKPEASQCPREALWPHLCSHSGLLFLKYTSSWPSPLLFPCLECSFLGISMTHSSLLTLFSNVTFSTRPSLATLSKLVAAHTHTHTLPLPSWLCFLAHIMI